MSKKYDVCAIGNALVDYEIEVADQFFSDHKVEKGLMTLVDEERQSELVDSVEGKIKKKQGGGSAANTIFGLAELGGKGFYTCKVADDSDGILYTNDLIKAGIDSNLDPNNLYQGTTGKCLVMITPDAERTMNTYLGITADFSVNELQEEAIKNSTYLFMEGFLVSSPTGLEAMKKAKELAQKHGVKVSLTFSDPSMVKYFGDQMKEVVGDGVDLLFCNIEEAELFTGVNGEEEVKKAISKVAREFVITKGKDGAVAFDGNSYHEIEPFPTKAIDATGAGDMFAGAFLYGINHGLSHAQAGKLASAASSAVVSKFGPRLNQNHIKEIRENVGI
ncbi:Sugar or nucleoside kinase, ribokinase family [Ekhidna lutea]|uniref:Sugar or nucleoside kinase, ribokinase family n=1 Tax=Ekhidna lutea TaxID=447679 RepID=A0A239ISI1_EKHLU|nr:adenosine kinase [Ekhidna lutea]SNS96736.1 Sugar or nucleoside kinase, ribokinase family [Ekhidna lutea]